MTAAIIGVGTSTARWHGIWFARLRNLTPDRIGGSII